MSQSRNGIFKRARIFWTRLNEKRDSDNIISSNDGYSEYFHNNMRFVHWIFLAICVPITIINSNALEYVRFVAPVYSCERNICINYRYFDHIEAGLGLRYIISLYVYASGVIASILVSMYIIYKNRIIDKNPLTKFQIQSFAVYIAGFILFFVFILFGPLYPFTGSTRSTYGSIIASRAIVFLECGLFVCVNNAALTSLVYMDKIWKIGVIKND